jgi:hypothetical protein
LRGKSGKNENQPGVARDLYQFDQFTSEHLKFIPFSGPKDPLQIYILADDAYRKNKTDRIHWLDALGLFASSIKLLEVIALWGRGALILAVISFIPWAWFFIGAICLHSLNISRELLDDAAMKIDLLTGQLPTPIRAGGEKKILMGAPTNHRHRWVWTSVWAVGAILSIASVVGCYLLLGQQTADTVYLFLGLQVLWLGLRSVFFHFSEGADKVFNHPSLTAHAWDQLPYSYRSRVRDLVFALSAYEIHVHPRGAYSYVDDARSIDRIPHIRMDIPQQMLGTAQEDGRYKVKIKSVIGDTMLSSAAWVFGPKLNSIDFYDSCIVTLDLGEQEVAIPSARVITDMRPDTQLDVESPWDVKYPPRGGSNSGTSATHWNYWIPLQQRTWLHLRTAGLTVLGEALGTVVTDEQVTQKLASGELFNSLTKVEDVNDIVDHSRIGCQILVSMLGSSTPFNTQ